MGFFAGQFVFYGYLRHLDQKFEDQMIESYLSSCNETLKVEKRKDKVPQMCYYQMKWRKKKNFQTLAENKRRIDA